MGIEMKYKKKSQRNTEHKKYKGCKGTESSQ